MNNKDRGMKYFIIVYLFFLTIAVGSRMRETEDNAARLDVLEQAILSPVSQR